MVLSRIISLLLSLALMGTVVLIIGGGARRMRTRVRCRCGYDPAGVKVCPECGRRITPERLAEDAVGSLYARLALIGSLGIIAVGYHGFVSMRLVLEIGRLSREGNRAFIPGYRLLDGVTPGDLLASGCALLLTLAAAAWMVRHIMRIAREGAAEIRAEASRIVTESRPGPEPPQERERMGRMP